MESTESPLLTDELSSDQALLRGEYICGMCNENLKEPRILNCLHEFCTSCLALRMTDFGVECSDCKQITSTTRVEELKLDVVLINLMEMEAIRTTSVTCTSCKAQENAVARCSDCATFLCPSCVTAHNYMRCFENHKVESFDDLKKEEARGIHKPMHCKQHTSEPLKYYCKSCQEPICTECTMSLHKLPEHTCDRASDIEDSTRHDLEKQLADVRKKLGSCEEASMRSEMMLSELQLSKDNAKDQILETYQSFKAILEKKKEKSTDCDSALIPLLCVHG